VISSSLRVPEAVDVHGREYALFRNAAVQMDLAVAGALEFLVDDIVHLGAGINQSRGQNGQAATFPRCARGAEETLGSCSALASTPPVNTLPEEGTTVL